MKLVSVKAIRTAHSLPITRYEDPAVSPLRGLAAFVPWLCCRSCQGSDHYLRAAPYSLRSPYGLAFGHYSAALRLLAALALRAGLRPLLRCAPSTRCACPPGWPSAITPLRSVYSRRLPDGLAFGHSPAALRCLAALALRARPRPLLRCAPFTRCACPTGWPSAITPLRSVCQETKSTMCSHANKSVLP